MHAGVHFALLAATFGIWGVTPGRKREAEAIAAPGPDAQLEHLQQSLDTIALEVERIGEAQRFMNKVVKEREQHS